MIACVLALVLLMDISGSVNQAQYVVQRDGTATALEDSEISRLIDRLGPVAIVAVEFGVSSTVTVPWTLIRNSTEIRAFAARVRGTERTPDVGNTATGEAILFSLDLLQQAPCIPEQEVIDISTDGESNVGRRPSDARDAAIARDVRINGLAFNTPLGSRTPVEWLREHVITPGGFVIEVTTPDEFPDAMRRKLVLEVTEAAHGRRYADRR